MLHIDIICIGKVKEAFFREAIGEYKKRLSKYCNLSIIELPDEKVPTSLSSNVAEKIKEKECNLIYSHIKKGSYIICLDLKGKQFSSVDFSAHIEEISLNISSHITFIIGGTLGINLNLLNRSHESICFSKMTFPHQLIRVFLLEQLFRAFKIANHETYHH